MSDFKFHTLLEAIRDALASASIEGLVSFPIADIQSFADDAAASAGGVPVGGVYRTVSALKIRVS